MSNIIINNATGVITATEFVGLTSGGGGGGGKLLQFVQNSTFPSFISINTTNYTNTGLTASITPTSSTSKILVIIRQGVRGQRSSGGSQGAGIKILRDALTIYTSAADATGPYEIFLGSGSGALNMYNSFVITHLDSPSTTSSITYSTQARPYTTANTGYIELNFNPPYITLMEIAP